MRSGCSTVSVIVYDRDGSSSMMVVGTAMQNRGTMLVVTIGRNDIDCGRVMMRMNACRTI